MIPTCARPCTSVFCPGPCPCTSADGLSTRRYSAGRRNRLPSSNVTSSSFSPRLRRSSTGQTIVLFALTPASPGFPSGRRKTFCAPFVIAQRARLVDEHDRDPVAYRIGKTSLFADQLLSFAVIAQRGFGQGADEDLEQSGVYFRRPFHACPPKRAEPCSVSGASAVA